MRTEWCLEDALLLFLILFLIRCFANKLVSIGDLPKPSHSFTLFLYVIPLIMTFFRGSVAPLSSCGSMHNFTVGLKSLSRDLSSDNICYRLKLSE